MMNAKYKVIKDIADNDGWECGAKEGDILHVRWWGRPSAWTLLNNEDKAIADVDSQACNECCELIISKELLLEKGFELNTYPQGNYFEFVTKDDDTMAKILDKDYMGDEESVILQLKEDFSNILLCEDANVWNLNDIEFSEIIKKL